jgi:hypothetical protein
MSVRATRPPPKAVTALTLPPTQSTRLAAVLSVGERVKAQQQAVPTAFEMRDDDLEDPDDLPSDGRFLQTKQEYMKELAELKARKAFLDERDREEDWGDLYEIDRKIAELEDKLKRGIGGY